MRREWRKDRRIGGPTENLTRWCNGSTRDFGSLCPGSNPGRVAPKPLQDKHLRGSLFSTTRVGRVEIVIGRTSLVQFSPVASRAATVLFVRAGAPAGCVITSFVTARSSRLT